MDLVFICRDASASSLVSNLLLAMEAQKAGKKVAVLFTQEALTALSGGVFGWPTGLQGAETRLAMSENARALDIPVMRRGEGRMISPLELVEKASQAGVPMFADPVWIQLLGLKGKLFPGVAEMDQAAVLKTLSEAKRVIGSY